MIQGLRCSDAFVTVRGHSRPELNPGRMLSLNLGFGGAGLGEPSRKQGPPAQAAGGLAGATYELQSIPGKRTRQLAGVEDLERLFDRFGDLCLSRRQS